ncbi:unnamed protein product [Urochloa humidicola]
MASAAIHGTQQTRPRMRRRRRQSRSITHLPMDVMLEIARRTDPATLARFAATCKDLRRHMTDPSFRSRRLGLRHGERFAPPSSLGQLVCKWDNDVYLEVSNTTVADGAMSPVAAGLFNRADNELCLPVGARGGLVLVRVVSKHKQMGPDGTVRVCDPATRRWQSLPPGPAFPGQHVLLVGGGSGAVGRLSFKVVKVGSVLSKRGQRQSLLIQTFSSERGAWGPKIMIPSPFKTSCSSLSPKPAKHLVVGDAVYWLCRNYNSFYVFKLDVGNKARLTKTELPPSFHRECGLPRTRSSPQVLLATAWVAGSPVVLVANRGRISAWTMMSGGHTAAKWTDQPRVVFDNEADIERATDDEPPMGTRVRLEWFAERSGVVLLSMPHRGFFWLDLQSGKIIRHYSRSFGPVTCPYEMD